MPLRNFRAPFIFYCDVPNHKDIKNKYYPRLKDILHDSNDTTVERWNCKVKTTFDFTVDCLWDDYFLDSVVWKHLDQMLKHVDLQYYPTMSELKTIWVNYYKDGAFQEVHDHVGDGLNQFSGIYIIDQKGSNKTSFIKNDFGILDSQVHTKDIEDIKEGTVIIFPSNLLHYVNPVEDERCSIAFNIHCKF